MNGFGAFQISIQKKLAYGTADSEIGLRVHVCFPLLVWKGAVVVFLLV